MLTINSILNDLSEENISKVVNSSAVAGHGYGGFFGFHTSSIFIDRKGRLTSSISDAVGVLPQYAHLFNFGGGYGHGGGYGCNNGYGQSGFGFWR